MLPVPRLRRHAAGPPGWDPTEATAATGRRGEPVRLRSRTPGPPAGWPAAAITGRGADRSPARRGDAGGAGGAPAGTLHRDQGDGVERLPETGDSLGAGSVPGQLLTASRRGLIQPACPAGPPRRT